MAQYPARVKDGANGEQWVLQSKFQNTVELSETDGTLMRGSRDDGAPVPSSPSSSRPRVPPPPPRHFLEHVVRAARRRDRDIPQSSAACVKPRVGGGPSSGRRGCGSASIGATPRRRRRRATAGPSLRRVGDRSRRRRERKVRRGFVLDSRSRPKESETKSALLITAHYYGARVHGLRAFSTAHFSPRLDGPSPVMGRTSPRC